MEKQKWQPSRIMLSGINYDVLVHIQVFFFQGFAWKGQKDVPKLFASNTWQDIWLVCKDSITSWSKGVLWVL